MNEPTTVDREKEEGKRKGKKGMPGRARLALTEVRDKHIVGLVDDHTVISSGLLAEYIGYERTPQGVQTAARLFERLAKENVIQFVTQFTTSYGVSVWHSLRKQGAKSQLYHLNMRSRRRLTWEQIITWDRLMGGDELRTLFKKQRNALVADDLTVLGPKGLTWEDETGSHTLPRLLDKCTLYVRKQRDLAAIFGVKDLKVVWNCDNWNQAQALLKALQQVEGRGMFLICHGPTTFDPGRPELLQTMPLFFWGRDGSNRRLLEEF